MKTDILRSRAGDLRKKGFSFKEISEKLKISKSTASLWLRDVKLSKIAKDRIYKLGVDGRNKGNDSVKNRIAKEDEKILLNVKNTINQCVLLENDLKVVCALLYWCEGGKTEKATLAFINSDPRLVKYFIDTFRKAFDIDESRFRAVLYVHDYHDVDRQIDFWSKIMSIPKKQFNKPYNKPNSGKRIKNDYQGCVSVRYHGKGIRQEMMFLIQELIKI
jgi:transcriptional regulator with XRE-family HTH domain